MLQDDLRSLRVGVVDGTSTVNFLDHQRIAHRVFANAPAGLNAVQTGSIDAFVYDCPLLSWIVKKDFANLQVLGDQQNYAIALPSGSGLRSPLDIVLLESVASEWWAQVLDRYLGRTALTHET